MKDRLKLILDYYNLSNVAFAESVELQESTVRAILTGKTMKISGPLLLALMEKYNINPAWFIRGEGEMFLTSIPIPVKKDQSEIIPNVLMSRKPINLEGMNGGAEIFEGELNHTRWFRKLSTKKKVIAAALDELTDEAAERIVRDIDYELRIEERRKAELQSSVENKTPRQKGEAG